MQILISDIQPSISYDNIRKHFSQYGEIKFLRFKGKYGFLEYKSNDVNDSVLSKDHIVDGKSLKISLDTRPPDMGRRPPDMGRRNRYENGYSDNTRGNFGRDRGNYSGPRYNEPCRYCEQCPVHGRYNDSLSRNNGLPRYRLVIDGLPEDCNRRDIYDFARKYHVIPSFIRITEVGNHAILEFNNFIEQDKALAALRNRQFLGKDIVVRPYFNNRDVKKTENDQVKDSNEKLYGDIDTDQAFDDRI
ncbi:putative splicing factor [Dictyocoela muelleri]|nr:putative splicing factor [Dictyocoela muelleri]